MSARPRVLLLDAHVRHAVGIVRSLGRNGIDVICAAAGRQTAAGLSRFAAGRSVFAPTVDGAADAGTLLALVEREQIDVVIAAALPGNKLLCTERARLEPHVRAPYNDAASFGRLANKALTVKLAAELDVPHPRSVELLRPEDAASVAAELKFPAVFKSAVDQGTVRYADNAAELRTIADEFWSANAALVEAGVVPLVQEYVGGSSHGFYALARDGQILQWFMHRRIHEVPPSGGPSAMAGAYRDPELRELGSRFFEATRWTGVAMVEFKKSERDGRYYLIEVNPKFWGSLDLSIAAGVDFPYELVRMVLGEPPLGTPGRYDDDRVFRWLTLDVVHALQTRSLLAYVRTFTNRRVADDLVLSDPLPLAMLVAKGIGELARGQRSPLPWSSRVRPRRARSPR